MPTGFIFYHKYIFLQMKSINSQFNVLSIYLLKIIVILSSIWVLNSNFLVALPVGIIICWLYTLPRVKITPKSESSEYLVVRLQSGRMWSTPLLPLYLSVRILSRDQRDLFNWLVGWLVGWFYFVLCHNKLCRLFNAVFCFYIYITLWWNHHLMDSTTLYNTGSRSNTKLV